MNILLVDDERDVRTSLARFLRKLGYTVDCEADGKDGLNKFHMNDYDLIIADIRMPRLNGIDFLRHIKKIEQSPTKVIIITGHGNMDNAVKSLKYGAYDYFQKPLNVKELVAAIKRCEGHNLSQNSNFLSGAGKRKDLCPQAPSGPAGTIKFLPGTANEISLEKLCVHSDAMRNVINLAAEYNKHRSISVLIEGETGTGKELVSRYIHYHQKADAVKPFVALNCAALPENLLEAELFGHERGAYTGATATGQKGKLELAQGGTIFFDEIGELHLNLQAKLLRVIEQKEFFRVGGIREVGIDVRIISATNKNLQEEMKANKFRPDLFYRINIATIRIPPLRERQDDILPLAIRFLKRASVSNAIPFEGFTPAAQEYLINYPWPGNVRQLENAMLNLALRKFGNVIDVDDLSVIPGVTQSDGASRRGNPILGSDEFDLPPNLLKLEDLNKGIIKQALNKNFGNITRTAQYLGISRRVLQGRVKRMGLS